MKRSFDIVFSIMALSIFMIPMLVIAVLLKYKEKHSVLFKQTRIGINKEPFDILKFQTLVNDIPTTTGALLRKTGLDELPQFINVLKGDMSIVGPRALTEYDIGRLEWNNNYYQERWSIKPGITGYAQVYGGIHKKISWFWDKKYVNHNTVIIDFLLVAVSFGINIFGKKKVQNIIWKRRSVS